jgi:hypothetical protein
MKVLKAVPRAPCKSSRQQFSESVTPTIQRKRNTTTGQKRDVSVPNDPSEKSGYGTHNAICRGADKSLAFPICRTTKIISLGWVKEVRTTKS